MYALTLPALFCTFSLGGVPVAPLAFTEHQPVVSVDSLDESTGHIGEVELEKLTFTLITEIEKLTLMVNDKTMYTLNGEKSEAEKALLTGSAARVIHADGFAIEVHVTNEG